jgi:aminoglycoside phosphotransferase (APT) family kinase protein
LSEGYGVPRLAALPDRAVTVARWEAAAGRKAEHLDYYERFATTRFAIIMARAGKLYMERGWLPAESEADVRNGGMAVLQTLMATN